MEMKKVYSRKFFENRQGTSKSAEEIVPLILELIHPKRLIDVGCGMGEWLSVFIKHGVSDILGVDGDWVDKDALLIPKEKFLPFDLRKPIRMDKQFDLVISLEVAEHLSEECAETFVDSLTALGPAIVFSAAIPFQASPPHHINEQWPEYWVKLFQNRGYVVIDCLRKKIWDNNNVEWWYAQNMLIFVTRDYLKTNELLQREAENTNVSMLSVVHPKRYLAVARYEALDLRVRSLPSPLRWVRRKVTGLLRLLGLAKYFK